MRSLFFACILLSILSIASAAVSAGGATFYVSPSGNDAWNGTVAQKSASGGPFATIQRAQKAVRDINAAGKLTGPATVYLRGGRYEIAEPLVFTPEDSGTKQAPVTWAAYKGEKPVVSGGRRISGWKPGENGRWIDQLVE